MVILSEAARGKISRRPLSSFSSIDIHELLLNVAKNANQIKK